MPEPLEKRLSHECFPQPSDSKASVWRYMSTAKFISLLKDSALWLAPLESLGDPHEGSAPLALCNALNDQFAEHDPQLRIGLAQMLIKMRSLVLVSCWNLSEYESEALWRLYTSSSEGIAIQASYESLVDVARSDNDLYIGCIKYIDYDRESFPADNLLYPAMHKRRAFSHESEVRLLRVEVDDAQQKPKGRNIKVNLPELIRGVYISPYAQEWYADTIRWLLAQSCPMLEERVHWSRMSGRPFY